MKRRKRSKKEKKQTISAHPLITHPPFFFPSDTVPKDTGGCQFSCAELELRPEFLPFLGKPENPIINIEAYRVSTQTPTLQRISVLSSGLSGPGAA
ncbi:hypothetical protein CEXT_301171 [Caerostris extrusa]|uniref:Uncharacterized protein n=1 Tax=Caerostris extrusa TaxID=172846 RepID=A0AAV4RI04_CAEEX|nr:hypothetical protein CEXT_301171 [Caerostris extrusa]